MHILTKVFVLIASLLAILVAALTVSFAINADRITGTYVEAQADALAARSVLDAQRLEHEQAINALTARLDALANERAGLRGDIQRLEAENARLLASERTAVADAARVQSQIGQFGETTQMQAQIIDDYRAELSRLREQELGFRQQRAEYEDRISDLTTQVQVLDDTQRALQERLAEAQTRLQELSQGATASRGQGQQGPITLDRLVRGRVQAVQGNGGQGSLIQLNLGTNDQIRQNVTLFITRGGQYIGRVQVVDTDLNSSVARVELLSPNMRVQQGDEVRTTLAMN